VIDDFIFAKLVWLTAQNTKRGVNMAAWRKSAAREQYEAVVRQAAADRRIVPCTDKKLPVGSHLLLVSPSIFSESDNDA
jgi:hypothetical protein